MIKKVFENASWIILCKLIQSIITLIIGMITARYLGPAGYGTISYAASIVAFFVPIVQLGLSSTLVQEFIAYPEKEGEVLGTSLLMNLFSSFLSILGVGAFVLIANHGDFETIVVCLLYSMTLVFRVGEIIQYWFQSKLLSKYPSIVGLVAYALVSIYKILILAFSKGIRWFAITHVIEVAIVSAVLYYFYLKYSEQKLSFSTSLAKKLFSRSKHYISASLLVVVFQQTDRVMLSVMMNETETGYYSAAITCIGMTGFVFSAIIDSARPVVLEGMKKSEAVFKERIIILFTIVTAISLLQSIGMTVLAKPIIWILYGNEYMPSVRVLQIAVWYVTFGYYGVVRNIWILAENKQRYLWLINLQGAIVNVILNFILIPYLGAVGAAWASLATQFFTNFILCFIFKPMRPIGSIILKSLNPKVLLGFIELLYLKWKK